MLLFDEGYYWIRARDGQQKVFEIFSRHYTFRKWRQRNGKNGKRIVGPGESLILLGKDGSALFVWRKERFKKDNQYGIACSVFRNEGSILSSILLKEAEEWAQKKWPGERMYTYVNPKKIKSSNPGYCFKVNGWRQCGVTKAKKLIILEKITNHVDATIS